MSIFSSILDILYVRIEVCNAMPVMAAVVQIAINLKMPRISHPMNRLDHWSSLVSNQEASPGMDLLPRATGDLLVTTDYVEIE